MNIVLINLWKTIDSRGGTEHVFCDLANSLSSKGHHVSAIFHENKSGRPAFPLQDTVNLINAGYPFNIYSKAFHRISLIARSAILYPFGRKNRKIALQKVRLNKKGQDIKKALSNLKAKPDIIISFNEEATYIIKSIIKSEVPTITMIHGQPNDHVDLYFTEIYKKSLEQCECIQVLLPEFIKEIKTLLSPRNIVVIPNAVPTYCRKSPLTNKRIICVGRLTPGKCQHLAIEAFSLLKNKYPTWRLDLFGDPSDSKYAAKLKDIIKNNRLESNIFIHPSTSKIEKNLENSSIFIFPSKYEGFPLAMTEAMAKGLPVIGNANCIATQSLIHNNINGIISQDNPQHFAKHLSTLMDSEKLRKAIGEQASNDMKKYSIKVITDEWEKLMLNILHNAK